MDPAATYHVGDRVSVPTFGNGIVRFFGPTQFQPGDWVGVQLDIAGTGKNDGSVKGMRYFTCDPNCGVFVRPTQVAPLQKTTPSTSMLRGIGGHMISAALDAFNITVEKPPLPAEPQKPPPLPVGGSFVTIPLSPAPVPASATVAAPAASTASTPPLSHLPPSTPAPAAVPVIAPEAPAAAAAATPSLSPVSVPTLAAQAANASDARSPPQRGPIIPPSASPPSGNSRPLSPPGTVSHLPPEVERRTAQQQRVQAELQERTRVMFNQVTDYVKAELAVTLEDYRMLETMNNVSKEKYAEMAQITEGLRGQMGQLENSYKELEPFLSKINDIESGVAELEKAVAALNAYAKRLEEKLRMPDKSTLAAGQAVSPVKITP